MTHTLTNKKLGEFNLTDVKVGRRSSKRALLVKLSRKSSNNEVLVTIESTRDSSVGRAVDCSRIEIHRSLVRFRFARFCSSLLNPTSCS